MSESNFKSKVYQLVRGVPEGKVTTYGEVARVLGKPRWARQVGWVLHQNKNPDVPCHRVVDRNGRLAPNFGGPSLFSFGRLDPSKSRKAGRSGAFNGAGEQRRRLEVEGVEFADEMHVDLGKSLWQE